MIATTLCLGVIGKICLLKNPFTPILITIDMWHTGVGGGGFMLVRSANGSYEFIDFRETAPAAASQNMYNSNINASIYGGLSR